MGEAQEQPTPISLLTLELLITVLTADSLDSRDLGRLECTCKLFWGPLPQAYRGKPEAKRTRMNGAWSFTTVVLSVIDEVGRLLVTASPHHGRRCSSTPRPGERWLRLLRDLERVRGPLVFTVSGQGNPHDPLPGSGITFLGPTATQTTSQFDWDTVACARAVMSGGLFKANFRIHRPDENDGRNHGVSVGVCRMTSGVWPHGSTGWPYGSPEWMGTPSYNSADGWAWYSTDGTLNHNNEEYDQSGVLPRREPPWAQPVDPHPAGPLAVAGTPTGAFYGNGDVIRLELDLEKGTLVGFKNGVNHGVLAEGLAGEFCWAVDLADKGDSVSVEWSDMH